MVPLLAIIVAWSWASGGARTVSQAPSRFHTQFPATYLEHGSAVAPGDVVGSVTFSTDSSSGLSVGIAFDGTNLWYSCGSPEAGANPDLLRADPTTGAVSGSYVLYGGLGALSYDATRNVIWAGWGGGSNPQDSVVQIALDGAKNVTGSSIAFNTGDFCESLHDALDDGLAFDARGPGAADDVMYYSNDCHTTTIRAYDLTGSLVESFSWNGPSCYNSGLAIGGQLLYQGADGCQHVWVADKTSKTAVFDFTTAVPSDPSFDEDLECDTKTFAPTDVVWLNELRPPMRAYAYAIPKGTCGIGGVTAVTLASFTAWHVEQGVELRWRTAQEASLLGFNVYRSGVKVNRALIVARHRPAGATYRLLDRDARLRAAFRLQAVTLDGATSWVGRTIASG